MTATSPTAFRATTTSVTATGPERGEIFLNPGDLYFGRSGELVGTLLGSCVSITMWHPALRSGGMCHYVVPAHAEGNHDDARPGHTALGAIRALLRHARSSGRPAQEFQFKIFGGGAQFARQGEGPLSSIGQRNVDAGLALLDEHGLRPVARHTGDTGYRRVFLDLATGQVLLRHARGANAPYASLT